MIDAAKIERLLARVRREVDEGLSPAVQIAVALDGEVVVDATFGAPDDSRFVVFSATKGLVAAAFWQLLDRGDVRLDAPVAHYLPAFETNGKGVVTVEQVLVHTGGFPYAPLGPPAWSTRRDRLEAFARWRLTLTPGETFMYHPTAGHWVLGEILAEVTGLDHTDAIAQMVTEPLGLRRLLGIAPDEREGIVASVGVGAPPTPAEMKETFGFEIDLAALIPPDVALGALLTLNDPDAQAVGVPGGGGVMRAADLALLYQAFLHDRAGLWSPEMRADGTGNVRNRLPDLFGVPANRTLGLVVAGDDGFAHRRGFGRTASPRSFGHNGAGGQLAFADPHTGLSVGYATAGLDQHLIRQQRRDTAIASLAADLLAD
ncbi:MAG: penicillin-binding protein beta-lactamase class [Acidimicrobiales bacterium]|nr:penicillin-binding protein beta-lactamase class [Acidimicrobiales bacterium]